MTRETYKDGRLVPIPGDKVFQYYCGFGGTQGSIHGEVYLSPKKELRVKNIVASGYFGAQPVKRTQKLTPSWTVENDPELERRKKALEKEESDKKKAGEIYNLKLAEANKMLEREGTRLTSWEEVKPGDRIVRIHGFYNSYSGTADPFTRIERVVTRVKEEDPIYVKSEGDKYYALGKQILPPVKKEEQREVTMGHARMWVKLKR